MCMPRNRARSSFLFYLVCITVPFFFFFVFHTSLVLSLFSLFMLTYTFDIRRRTQSIDQSCSFLTTRRARIGILISYIYLFFFVFFSPHIYTHIHIILSIITPLICVLLSLYCLFFRSSDITAVTHTSTITTSSKKLHKGETQLRQRVYHRKIDF